jgi:hypothetical protein
MECAACGSVLAEASATSDTETTSPVFSPPDQSPASHDRGPVGFTPGEIIGERYRIVGLLGRGGMGEVYRADDLKLGLPVALKFLPRAVESDPAALARLHEEVRNARRVSHPHVCRVHDIAVVEGRHFLTMEFVDGEDLATLLRRIGHLPERKATEIARQICAGLRAAHERGVIHRDLKPANIMLDGHGRVRITDFGLAVAGTDARGEIAGTPAYMAPEQLAGALATVRSDIYALGLVLYEIYTGRRPFEATTFVEWKRAHAQELPTNPSIHARGLDPVIEQLILRCIEKDAAHRIPSATRVALALPGGDPLAAAIEAGETPSPEMVAAAPMEGGLRTRTAAALLAAVVILLFLSALGSGGKLYRWVPFGKPPAVLQDRATELIASLGYDPHPADHASGFDLDQGYFGYPDDPLPAPRRWDRLRTGQPLTYFYWYRQSPISLRPRLRGAREACVTLEDPPQILEGMVSLRMDPRGRLVEFRAVPPAIASVDSARRLESDTLHADFGRLFAAAGLDPARFAPALPLWNPPTFADERLAWAGSFADHPDLSLRVEAAACAGRPVFFRTVAPWDHPESSAPARVGGTEIAANSILLVLIVGILVSAGLLALQNSRMGRGDRRGAWRLACAGVLITVAGILLRSDMPMSLPGITEMAFILAGNGLLFGAILAVSYLALEPYVRRNRPQLLVSWARLLAGDLRNPMIGRDLLIGTLLGTASAAATTASGLLKMWSGSPVPPNRFLDTHTLQGLFHSDLVFNVVSAWVAFAVLLFLAVGRRFLRREWIGAALLWIIVTGTMVLFFARSWPVIAAVMIGNALMIVGVARFGLLAGVTMALVNRILDGSPLTLDFSIFYVHAAVAAFLVTLAPALFGFWTSRGRRRAA